MHHSGTKQRSPSNGKSGSDGLLDTSSVRVKNEEKRSRWFALPLLEDDEANFDWMLFISPFGPDHQGAAGGFEKRAEG